MLIVLGRDLPELICSKCLFSAYHVLGIVLYESETFLFECVIVLWL